MNCFILQFIFLFINTYIHRGDRSLNPDMNFPCIFLCNSAFLIFVFWILSIHFSSKLYAGNTIWKSTKWSTTLPLWYPMLKWLVFDLHQHVYRQAFCRFENALRYASHSAKISIASKLHKHVIILFFAGRKRSIFA